MKKKQENSNTVLPIIPESLGKKKKKALSCLGWKGRGRISLCLFPVLARRSLSFMYSCSELLHCPLGRFPSQLTDADAHPSQGCLQPHDLQQHIFPVCLLGREGRAMPTACRPACTEGKFVVEFTHGHSQMHAHVQACTWITHSQNQMILQDRIAEIHRRLLWAAMSSSTIILAVVPRAAASATVLETLRNSGPWSMAPTEIQPESFPSPRQNLRLGFTLHSAYSHRDTIKGGDEVHSNYVRGMCIDIYRKIKALIWNNMMPPVTPVVTLFVIQIIGLFICFSSCWIWCSLWP